MIWDTTSCSLKLSMEKKSIIFNIVIPSITMGTFSDIDLEGVKEYSCQEWIEEFARVGGGGLSFANQKLKIIRNKYY